MSLTWNPDKFKAQLLNDLVANGEIVGKFVEGEARRRLLDIQEPEWGTAYRSQIVSNLLTNTVEKDGEAVVISVGVAVGPSGQHHGLYIELGSSTAPAHPFIRPAVFENAGRIVALLSGK